MFTDLKNRFLGLAAAPLLGAIVGFWAKDEELPALT